MRRDGTELGAKMMEEMLNCLIDSKDLSQVKEIFKREYSDLVNGFKIPKDLYLAKEIKAIRYSQKHMPAHG